MQQPPSEQGAVTPIVEQPAAQQPQAAAPVQAGAQAPGAQLGVQQPAQQMAEQPVQQPIVLGALPSTSTAPMAPMILSGAMLLGIGLWIRRRR